MLYLPSPDPSSVDVHADSRVALGLSEAGLPFPGSGSCSETEDPVCARALEWDETHLGTSSSKVYIMSSLESYHMIIHS